MNQNDFFYFLFSNAVNQAIMNRQRNTAPLPEDQQEALEKILDAIHDLFENKQKIKNDYQPQAFDAVVLKIAAEIGWSNRGYF